MKSKLILKYLLLFKSSFNCWSRSLSDERFSSSFSVQNFSSISSRKRTKSIISTQWDLTSFLVRYANRRETFCDALRKFVLFSLRQNNTGKGRFFQHHRFVFLFSRTTIGVRNRFLFASIERKLIIARKSESRNREKISIRLDFAFSDREISVNIERFSDRADVRRFSLSDESIIELPIIHFCLTVEIFLSDRVILSTDRTISFG